MCIRDRYTIFWDSKKLRKFKEPDVDKMIDLVFASSNYAIDCLLYTSDAADERSSVDLGGRRIIKKNTKKNISRRVSTQNNNHITNIQQIYK